MRNSRCWAAVAALVAGAGLLAGAAPAVALPAADPVVSPALPPGGSFVPVAPARVLDTRHAGGPVTSTAVAVGALPGVPHSGGVAAVLLNVTVVDAAGPGYVVVGAGQGTSNGNFVARTASATLALVRAPGPTIPITTSARADVVVDVQGYVTTRATATSATFTPLRAPRRAADSRSAFGLRPFTTGQTQTLDLRTGAALPADATAVVANLTVAGASTATYVTAWSGAGTRPAVSSVNAARGDVVANRAVVPLDASGRIALFNYSGRTDVVVDVVGYLSSDPAGAYYTPVTASRLVDATASGVTVTPTVGFGVGTAVLAPSAHDLAPTAAVWLTVAGDQPRGRGYVAVRPGGSPPAGTSDLDLVPGRAVANAGPATVAADGTVTVVSVPTSRIVVDLSGWFVRRPAPATAGLWSSSRWVDYSDDPVRRDTLPTDLPSSFAGGVFLGDTHTSTRAFATGAGGTVQETDHGGASPGQVAPWTRLTRIGTLAGVTALATGGDRTTAATYALDALGRVYGFQSNTDGELGTSPTPFITYPLTPTPVALPQAATAVAAAQDVGYAVGVDGTVYSWGRADTGQLGRIPTAAPWTPAPVTGLTSPTAIAGDGDVSFAVDADGHTLQWGTPVGGTTQAQPTPTAAACGTATALHADVNGVWELCDDGTVVQLSDRGATFATAHTLPVAGVTAIGAGAGYGAGIRALLTDGRVADVPTTGGARYEAGFGGVTAVNGSPGVQITQVGD